MKNYYKVLDVVVGGKVAYHNIVNIGASNSTEAKSRFYNWTNSNGWTYGVAHDKRLYANIPYKYGSFKTELFA